METLQQQKTTQKASYGSRSSVSDAAISYPSRTIVHAKLEMTEPGDHDEQEADAAANDIVSSGKIRRKISNGGGNGIAVSPQVESQIAQLQGGGHAMPAGLRNMMENGFGRDFSQVRLHTDSQAADMSSSISARAFTHGNDIYFNRGQFSPNTSEGQRLVAHELTHVAQGTRKVGREDLCSVCSIEREDLCSVCPYSDYTVLLDKLKKSGVFDETAQKNLEWIVMYYFQYMHQFEMEDINNIAHFFSQVYGEVSSLSKFEEGFFYSPERLANIFPKIFAEKDTGSPNEKAKELGRRKGDKMPIENQKGIANLVYGGKYGNSQTGDGWKYRGRGLLQITFKDNYEKINDIIAKTTGENFDIVGNPDQIITNDKLKVLTAMAYWKKRQLNTKLKKENNNVKVTKEVTGGEREKEVAKRKKAYDKIIECLK